MAHVVVSGRRTEWQGSKIRNYLFSDLTAKRETLYVLYVLYVINVLSVLNVSYCIALTVSYLLYYVFLAGQLQKIHGIVKPRRASEKPLQQELHPARGEEDGKKTTESDQKAWC